MRILGPKFVKKANSWCVTVFTAGNKGVESQVNEWFSTREEAEKFIESKG